MATKRADPIENPSDAGASRSPVDVVKKPAATSIVLRIVLAAAVLLGVAYAIAIRPQFGTVTVEIADADAKEIEVVFRTGEERHLAGAEDGWKVRLKEGKWNIEIVGDPNHRYQLDKESLTLLRSTEETVRVLRRGQNPVHVSLGNATVQPTPPATDPLLAVLKGHEADVSALAYSPVRGLLASSSFDGTTKLWDAATGKLLATLGGHSSRSVWSVAFSPDGEILATAGGDGKILLWNAGTQSFLRVLIESEVPEYQGPLIHGAHDVSNICFSPDGKMLAVPGIKNDSINLWDLESGSLVRSLELTEDRGFTPTHIAFGPQGKRLAVSGHQDYAQGRLAMLDVEMGTELWTITKGKWMPAVAFSPDGKLLATGNTSERWARLLLLDSTDGQIIDRLSGYHDSQVWSVAFSPDGKTLASCSRKVRIWDVASRSRMATLTGHQGFATDLVFCEDGRTIASSSTDLDIKIWDVPAVIAASRQREQEQEQQSLAELPLEPATTSALQTPVLVHEGFDGKLEQDWEILQSDPSHVSFTKNPGALTITTQQGGFNNEHANFNNVFLLQNPLTEGEDFTITTCLEAFRPLDAWTQAGLLCFDDEDNYIKYSYEAETPHVRRFNILSEQMGVRSKTGINFTFNSEVDRLWLRVTKRGQRYDGSFSLDGNSFRSIGELTWGSDAPKKLGVVAQNGPLSNAPSVDASFDFFEMRKAPPVAQIPDRYAVPEGGVEELLKFIQEMQRFRPRSSEQHREHQLKSTKAIKIAARKILDSETDGKSEAVLTARRLLLEDRLRVLRSASLSEKQAVVHELEEILEAKVASKVTSADLSMAMLAASSLEYDNQHELAAEAYESFASLVAGSDNQNLARIAGVLEGSARRLRLIGNELELNGVLLDGSEFDWSAYRGKVVLVDFWATWCGPCVAEIPNVREHYDEYHDRGFDVVGISLDRTRKSLTDFLAKHELPWVTLHEETSDGSNAMAVHYGIRSIPTVILVDQEGKVVSLRARGPELGRLLNDLLGPVESEEPQIENE